MSPFWFLCSAVAALAVLTLLPLSRSTVWWVRGLDFPRLQLAALAGLLGTLEMARLDFSDPWHWTLVAVTVGCAVYHGIWIWPYTKLAPVEAQPASATTGGQRLRVLAANVLMTNRRADLLLARVTDFRPDLIVTVETDRWWQTQLAGLETDFPHRLSCPLENLYGMHLFSRFPLGDARIQYLVEDDKPSMHALVHLPGGQRVQLHCLHPAPPSPTENESSSERDAELVMVGRAVANEPIPVLVAGDLNDVAWSATTRLFRKVSGLLDPRIGRGMFNTYHTRFPCFRWPLDHFFHSREFTVVRLERLPSIGSDHFPIFIELALADAAADRADPGLAAEPEDLEEAHEKLAEEDVSPREVHRPRDSREPAWRGGYQAGP